MDRAEHALTRMEAFMDVFGLNLSYLSHASTRAQARQRAWCKRAAARQQRRTEHVERPAMRRVLDLTGPTAADVLEPLVAARVARAESWLARDVRPGVTAVLGTRTWASMRAVEVYELWLDRLWEAECEEYAADWDSN